VVIEGETGWVFPTGDPRALAGRLESTLALTPEARRTLARLARTRVEQQYSLQLMIARYEQLYAELLEAA
jgi:glycosyltransferase involved in cell wall biosynthesis